MKRIAWTLQAGVDGAAGNLTNLIEENQLERTLSKGLEGIPGLRPDRAARALIEQLRGRNFMLCFMGGGNYAFVHRTFLEYFCAEAIVDSFQVEQTLTLEELKADIFGRWPDETWHEVLRLVAGRIAAKFLKDILVWLVEQPDPSGTCQNIFLAAQCVGEVRNRATLEGVDNTILDNLKMLAQPNLDLFLRQSCQVAIDFFQQPTEQQAIRLVSMIWQDDPETKAWLYSLAESSESPVTGFSALDVLMTRFKDDSDLLGAVRSLAQSSRNKSTRILAISILPTFFLDRDNKTLAIIKELAQFDQDADIRRNARLVLGLGWKEYPAVEAFLDGL
jgi:hypothetical protein